MSKSSFKDFNIENLFSSHNSKPHTKGKLDINTLFKNAVGDNTHVIVDSDILLNGVRKRKLKLEDINEDIFMGCWRTITEANDSGITDIYYDVPENIVECIDYNPKKCMTGIKDKLSEQCIQSIIIKGSKTKMFITWEDLEKRRLEKAKKEAEKENSDINSMSAFESKI